MRSRQFVQPKLALNHVTAPNLGWRELLDLAKRIGCSGVELRNDLDRPLFDGDDPEVVGKAADDLGLSIFAVAEVYGFNDADDAVIDKVEALGKAAKAVRADAIVLIPRRGGPAMSLDDLCEALGRIGDRLADLGMRGLVEPLGFEDSSLRHVDLAREAIADTHGSERFGIVHDPFHHHLASGGACSADMIDVVHVSGVSSTAPGIEPTDADRGLVDAADVMNTIGQLQSLAATGFAGPVSMEAFSPNVQALNGPEIELRRSFEFILEGYDQLFFEIYNDTINFSF